MKHFFKVGDLNAVPLLHAVMRQPELWNQNKLRTEFPGTPHAEADDIWLWFNEIRKKDELLESMLLDNFNTRQSEIANDIQTFSYPAWDALPQARQIVFDLMRATEASQLGRVIITKLAPGKKIAPHKDAGAPVEFFKRYQVALQSLPGAQFVIEDENVNFQNGEVWLINNKTTHAVYNNSKDDRIVMIVDLRTG